MISRGRLVQGLQRDTVHELPALGGRARGTSRFACLSRGHSNLRAADREDRLQPHFAFQHFADGGKIE